MGELTATPEMSFYCFDVVYSYHLGERLRSPKFTDEKCGVFVTWRVIEDQSLRGCVGTRSHENLHINLKYAAKASATEDPRFPPISLSEIPKLQASVSLLIKFEEAKDYLDWTVGLHGIWIKFTNEQGLSSGATYLPEFAAEKGPDQVKVIDALLRKGGFKGTITDDLRKSIKLTRYQTSKVTATFDQYKEAVFKSFAGIKIPR